MNPKKGRKKIPWTIFAYGRPGIGKSSRLEECPNPILISDELKDEALDVTKFEDKEGNFIAVGNHQMLLDQLDWLIKNDHDFKTLGLNTLNGFCKQLEPIVLMRAPQAKNSKFKPTMVTAYGGYQAAYKILADIFFDDVISRVEILRRQKGMNVYMTAHQETNTFNCPVTHTKQDQYIPSLQKYVLERLNRWVQCILCARLDVYEQTGADEKEHAGSDGERKFFCVETPYQIAKNPFGLPESTDLDMVSILEFYSGTKEKQIQVDENCAAELYEKIHASIALLPENDTKKTVIGFVEKLISNPLTTIEQAEKCLIKIEKLLN